jgi:ferric iron reductase protein FhuF
MDYKELKKEELIALLEKQKHLAQAVNAKDREIIELKNKTHKMMEEHTEKVNSLNESAQEKIAAAVQKQTKDLVEKVAKVEEENKRLVDLFGRYIDFARNTLKAFQGQLDTSIELETLLTEKIIGRGKE